VSSRACPICGGTDIEDIGPYRSQSPELKGMRRVRCATCELVYADPAPTEAEWAQYNANYFQRAHGHTADSAQARAFRRAAAEFRVAHVLDYLGRQRREITSVLEIGPGHGEFVVALRRRYPRVGYYAEETDRNQAAKLEKLGVQILTPAQSSTMTGVVDLVVVSHVLEHTIDPLAFLAGVARPLKSGGTVFIEVPCLDYLYKGEDEPHLQFFDKRALGLALARSGFNSAELTYHGESHSDLTCQKLENGMIVLIRRVLSRVRSFFSVGRGQLSGAEWAMARQFQLHSTSATRARWLRAMAVKGTDMVRAGDVG
jgi:SAM-dependent methyltransferase